MGQFEFLLADGSRVPEDAQGRLKTESREYAASVISQHANRIVVELSGDTAIPDSIFRAILSIDDTALLSQLADQLEGIAASPVKDNSLASMVFHPHHVQIGCRTLPALPAFLDLKPEKRKVIERACGSSITYVWGPPGTGKTYLIAHLITALIEADERVLVASHTHAAVDEALFKAVNEEEGDSGPLAGHPFVKGGRILRIGRVPDNSKIPDTVRLDKVLERKAGEIQARLTMLEERVKPLSRRRSECSSGIATWNQYEAIAKGLQSLLDRTTELRDEWNMAAEQVDECTSAKRQCESAAQEAGSALVFRTTRMESAMRALEGAEKALAAAKEAYASIVRDLNDTKIRVKHANMELLAHGEKCSGLLPKAQLENELIRINVELVPLEAEISAIQDELSRLQQQLIADTRAIFCTLTKAYIGKELEGQQFDAVIVDEISMALPPLIFIAAMRATKRVTLVGDFCQLPPIVRSDSEISNARLREDTFHLSRVAIKGKPNKECTVLTRLATQERMLTPIANVARHLAYPGDILRDDEEKLNARQPPAWLDFLPNNPLMVMDTADLHCWSGKQPGTLSRFNFYSANLSVELAAMAAARDVEKIEHRVPTIGIVTPYAAQRRLLAKLVRELRLEKYVAVGTVHTFQGGQADLIIFDCVLDEPYWSSRLTNPQNAWDVIRDLNVAVTRAKNKFVFVGSSSWLNRRASKGSALRKLWFYLKRHAKVVKASDLVEKRFQQLTSPGLYEGGWNLPALEDSLAHEILDETTFFTRFAQDLASASKSIFGLVPFFGEYRWPTVQPLFASALARGVEVTLVTPPLEEAQNRSYVEEAIENLRSQGAVVITASGLHGKEIVIDERTHYTGSLNWASHRGRVEVMHRTVSQQHATLVLQYLQTKHIRGAAVYPDGSLRTCPFCRELTKVVNQRRLQQWDKQVLKVGCSNSTCRNYLRNIDERPPFRDIPRCKSDSGTRYHRVQRRGRKAWECPAHPRSCPIYKVVPGDPT